MDPCPHDDDLKRFLCDDGQADVALHLRGCSRCQKEVERLTDDPALRRMAASLAATRLPDLDDSEISQLVRALCQSDTSRDAAMPPQEQEPEEDLGRLGPFAIEAEIGRGGMGIVYLARDTVVGRDVALKVLRMGISDERARRRFVQEMSLAARVEHDHVVRLYATSDPADRVPYLVMEYVAGPTLAARIRMRPGLDPREAARFVAQVGDGLQAIHQMGLVHRDVKPSNILIDPRTHRAKIGDFGIARHVDSTAEGLTRFGEVAGTPAYLSPEQICKHPRDLRASDVYALGVTLYECLVGEPPFRGDPHAVVAQILSEEPRPPRMIDFAISRDLETICLKAMSKEPSRRYLSAGELADDLRRFLDGTPIFARPAGLVERVWRWSRRNTKMAVLAASIVALLVVLAAGSSVAAVWIARERTKAVAEGRRAEDQRTLALDAFTALVGGIQDQLGTRPGTLELRKALLSEARDGLGKIAKGRDARADLGTLEALGKLGDVNLALGRSDEARADYQRAVTLAEAMAAADPQSVDVRRALASSYGRLGELARREYRPKDAMAPDARALEICQNLSRERPTDRSIMRLLRAALVKMGHDHESVNDFRAARAEYDSALAMLLQETPDSAADSPMRLSDERFLYGRIAALAMRELKSREAVDASRKSLEAAERLSAIDPQNAAWNLEKVQARQLFAKAVMETADFAEASRQFLLCLRDREAMVKADPADLSSLRALGLAHQDLGDIEALQLRGDAAKPHYLAAISCFDEAAARDPSSLTAHKDRLLSRRKIETSEACVGRYLQAERWAEEEIAIQNAPGVPPHHDLDGWRGESKMYRDLYRALPFAMSDPEYARTQPPQIATILGILRPVILARAGRHEAATSEARAIQTTAPAISARVFAISARFALEPLRASYLREAMDNLRAMMAIDPGFVRTTIYDPEFAIVRGLATFHTLKVELGAK